MVMGQKIFWGELQLNSPVARILLFQILLLPYLAQVAALVLTRLVSAP